MSEALPAELPPWFNKEKAIERLKQCEAAQLEHQRAADEWADKADAEQRQADDYDPQIKAIRTLLAAAAAHTEKVAGG